MAFVIQTTWKKHIAFLETKRTRGMVDFIFTSVENSSIGTKNTKKLFDFLEKNRIPFRCFDLVKYKSLNKIVEVKE